MVDLVNSLKNKYIIEVIIVNDCSPDNSEEQCILCYKNSEIVKFISLAKNVGEHNTNGGLNFVSGDYTVIMDDDFQNPVSEVVKLIDFAVSKIMMLYIHIMIKIILLRNLGSAFNDRVATYLIKKPKDLYLSSFKILNKFLVNEIIKYDLPFPYIDGLILRTTSNIGKIKLSHSKRRVGTSNYTIRKLFSLWLNMFTNFSIIPLRVSMISGILFSFFGFLYGLFAVYEKLNNPVFPWVIQQL